MDACIYIQNGSMKLFIVKCNNYKSVQKLPHAIPDNLLKIILHMTIIYISLIIRKLFTQFVLHIISAKRHSTLCPVCILYRFVVVPSTAFYYLPVRSLLAVSTNCKNTCAPNHLELYNYEEIMY